MKPAHPQKSHAAAGCGGPGVRGELQRADEALELGIDLYRRHVRLRPVYLAEGRARLRRRRRRPVPRARRSC